MNYDFNNDDEAGYADDDLQQDNETATDGAYDIKKKHGRTIDRTTVDATPLDTDLLPEAAPEHEAVEVRRGKTAEDDEERETKSPRADKTAKQQINDKLATAKASFGKWAMPKKEPANDNFRPVASWPLIDQLTRSTFEPDEERRIKSISTARYLRGLIDLANADPLGDETDCDIQRTESGRVHFDHGMSLDRKKRTYDGNRNGEQGAVRHDGPVRTAKYVVPIGNRINRNDPFPIRQIAARVELNEIIVAVGPLWKWLYSALAEDATMTEIGFALGAKGSSAPLRGVRTVRLALTAAMDAIDLRKDVSRETTPLPDKSRGSYWNQATGPVVKVAA